MQFWILLYHMILGEFIPVDLMSL